MEQFVLRESGAGPWFELRGSMLTLSRRRVGRWGGDLFTQQPSWFTDGNLEDAVADDAQRFSHRS